MPEPLQFRTAYRSAVGTVREVRCRPACSQCGAAEYSDRSTIVFVRRGMFVRHLGRERVVADPNQVLFFSRGGEYRVSHPVEGGDDCVSFAPADDVLAELLPSRDPERPFPVQCVSSEPAVDLAMRGLVRMLRELPRADLAIDEIIVTLFGRLIAGVPGGREKQAVSRRADTVRAHRDLAVGAQTVLARRMAEPLPLDDLARSVHSSAFHLCRVFRRETGLSLHQYRTRLRLRSAMERLAGGERDTTALALELGFSSRGHFSDTFRHELGLSPSAFRQIATVGRLREMSKKLGAWPVHPWHDEMAAT